MRTRLAIGIVCLPLLAPGCFSSSASDDIAPVFDAGLEDGGDATVLADAAPGDAAPAADVATPEAGPAVVTVIVASDLGVEPGATVVFQDATGTVLTTATTDAAGKATANVPAGSQVTAVLGTPQVVQLVTIEAVAPGDTLLVHDATNTTVSNAVVSIDSLPDPLAGTSSYQVQIGNCTNGFTDLPGQVNLSPDCENGGVFPVLVEALDSESQPLGFTYQNGNTLPLDGGAAHVSLDGTWSTASNTASIFVSNYDTQQSYAYGLTSEIANGVAAGYAQYLQSDYDGGGGIQSQGHPGYPTSIQNEVNVSSNRGANIAVTAVATRSPASLDGGTASFDLSTFLPLLDDVTLDSSQAGQPTVSWVTEAGSLASANGTVVALAWNDANDAGMVSGTWTFVAPPTASSVHAPALPASLAAMAPGPDANFVSPANVIVVQGSFLASYSDLRARFASLPPTSGLIYDTFLRSGVVPPLPVDGTLRLTAFTYNAD